MKNKNKKKSFLFIINSVYTVVVVQSNNFCLHIHTNSRNYIHIILQENLETLGKEIDRLKTENSQQRSAESSS